MIVQLFWIKEKNYFWYMCKVEAINIMKNSDLKENSGSFKKYKKSFLCMCIYKRWIISLLTINEIEKDC